MLNINKPIEAWIHEDGTLHVGFPEGKPPFAGVQATVQANEVLLEWDYGVELTYIEIRDVKEVLYVDPGWYNEEPWPHHGVSETKRSGWIEVWKVDLEDIYAHRAAASA